MGIDVGEGEDAVFGSEPDVLGAVVVHQAIVMDVEIEVVGMRGLKPSGSPSYNSCSSYSACLNRLLYLRLVVRYSEGGGVVKRASVKLCSVRVTQSCPVVYAQGPSPRFYWTAPR